MQLQADITSNVLCVDIGATWIKASVIKMPLSIKDLTVSKIYLQRTLGWLNKSLPEILSSQNSASIINHSIGQFDNVGIAVPGVVNNGQFFRVGSSVPKELIKEFQRLLPAGCNVKMVNDADAWMRGAITYHRLKKEPLEYPCISIVLGTGVGLAVALSATDIRSIEIFGMPNHFIHLEKISGQKINSPGEIHDLIGKNFFDWADRKHRDDWFYDVIRREFTNRVFGFLLDIQYLIPYEKIKTFIFCGGNAEYIQEYVAEKVPKGKLITLNKYSTDVDPNFIPLLGLSSLF